MKRVLTLIIFITFITFVTLSVSQVAADSAPYPPYQPDPPKMPNQPVPISYTSTVVFVGELMGWLVGVDGLMLLTKMSIKKCCAVSGVMMVVSYLVGLLMWHVVL